MFVPFQTGHTINFADLVFEPPRSGLTLWEMGVPERSAVEFFVPDPDAKYLNKLFLNKDMLVVTRRLTLNQNAYCTRILAFI